MTNYYLPNPGVVDEDYLENITGDLRLALVNMIDNDDPDYKQEHYDTVQELLKFIDALADTLMPDDEE